MNNIHDKIMSIIIQPWDRWQIIPTSCWWSQSCTPMPPWVQFNRLDSLPMHWTSSRWMGVNEPPPPKNTPAIISGITIVHIHRIITIIVTLSIHHGSYNNSLAGQTLLSFSTTEEGQGQETVARVLWRQLQSAWRSFHTLFPLLEVKGDIDDLRHERLSH